MVRDVALDRSPFAWVSPPAPDPAKGPDAGEDSNSAGARISGLLLNHRSVFVASQSAEDRWGIVIFRSGPADPLSPQVHVDELLGPVGAHASRVPHDPVRHGGET